MALDGREHVLQGNDVHGAVLSDRSPIADVRGRVNDPVGLGQGVGQRFRVLQIGFDKRDGQAGKRASI
jgi:hypothetical protein